MAPLAAQHRDGRRQRLVLVPETDARVVPRLKADQVMGGKR